MSDDPIQIFISYARYDDEKPPDLLDAHGFVTFLHKQLEHQFVLKGEPRPRIWRDVNAIGKGDQFTPRLRQAIDGSSILLVVLSRNWMSRDNCRQELEAFAERWKDGPGVREQIVAVGMNHVDQDERPLLLQGQEGFKFYDLDHPDNIGLEREYFRDGRILDKPRFESQLWELAGYLWRKAAFMKRKNEGPPPTPLPRPPNGLRTIFVAKPAYDMRDAYYRVVREMLRRGYTVVPDPMVDIPYYSGTALKFVDEKLAQAEASIHLLGERAGYVPEGAEAAIVSLQLKSAGARIGQLPAGTSGQGSAFCRLIWAPELPESGSEPENAWPKRNPIDVLKTFDSYRESDEIVGGSLSKFVDFLVQYLVQYFDRPDPPGDGSTLESKNDTPVKRGSRIYLYHRRDDRSYAKSVAMALSDRKVRLPPIEGEDAERERLHRQELANCDMVVLSWAIATDAWAQSAFNELKNWHVLGRTKNFERRGLVLGPPPRQAKSDFVDLPLPDEVDVMVDQRANDPPSPAELEKLFAPRNP